MHGPTRSCSGLEVSSIFAWKGVSAPDCKRASIQTKSKAGIPRAIRRTSRRQRLKSRSWQRFRRTKESRSGGDETATAEDGRLTASRFSVILTPSSFRAATYRKMAPRPQDEPAFRGICGCLGFHPLDLSISERKCKNTCGNECPSAAVDGASQVVGAD